jgi:hypothetical protein
VANYLNKSSGFAFKFDLVISLFVPLLNHTSSRKRFREGLNEKLQFLVKLLCVALEDLPMQFEADVKKKITPN